MVYAATLSKSQKVMRWRLILEEFGPNIQHIAGVDNIVSDTLIRLLNTSINKYGTCTGKAQCHTNELFDIGKVEKKSLFPLNILVVQIEQQE